MTQCLFCKIVSGEIPSRKVFENDELLVFHDINPAAPVHLLVIPKTVIPRLGEAVAGQGELLGHLLLTAASVAGAEGLAETGFRVVINHGPHGGETVPHLHVHVLGGRQLGWPPG